LLTQIYKIVELLVSAKLLAELGVQDKYSYV